MELPFLEEFWGSSFIDFERKVQVGNEVKLDDEHLFSYLLSHNLNLNGDEYADAKGAWTDYSIRYGRC